MTLGMTLGMTYFYLHFWHMYLPSAVALTLSLHSWHKARPKRNIRHVCISDGNRTVPSREVPERSQDGTGQDRTGPRDLEGPVVLWSRD